MVIGEIRHVAHVALLWDRADIVMISGEVEKLRENRSKFGSAAFEGNSRNAIWTIDFVGYE